MSSKASSWFIGLQEEERAYHTCVSTDEAFLRAFRSTSFRIRTREQLRRQWHQSQEEGGKNHNDIVASSTLDSSPISFSTTEYCGAHSGSRDATGPATTEGSRNPYTSSENLNVVQDVTSKQLDDHCLTSNNVLTTTEVATSDNVNSSSFNSSSTNKINECIHNLLSNVIVFCPESSSGTKRSSMRKLKFSSSILRDPTLFFSTINAVLKDENPALNFLDPLTTWPQWYDGNDEKALKGVTERKFILHILALVDMNIRSAHRQWLQRDEALVLASMRFKSITAAAKLPTNNGHLEQKTMSLYNYLEFLDKKLKTPAVNISKDEVVEHGDKHNDTKLTKCAAPKAARKKKKARKKEPRQQKSGMETSGEQVPSTHFSNNEAESTECCSSSILASVHSNKENGESSVPSNSESKATLRTSSSNSNSNHPLVEVNVSSKDPSLEPVEPLPKAKGEEKGDDAEESWTVVSKKISTSSLSQVKTKVKAAPRQPSYVTVVSSSSTNSAAKAAPTANVSSSSSSIASSVPPKSATSSEKIAETLHNKTANVQTKMSFSSIAAGTASATQSSDAANLMRQHGEALTVSKKEAPSSKEGFEQKHGKEKPHKIATGTDAESTAFSKKNLVQNNRTNVGQNPCSNNQRHQKNSSYSIHLTVRQAPTSPKKYHPQSCLSMQRQQSGKSNTTADNNKKNRHSTKHALPMTGQSSRQHLFPNAPALRQSSTDDSQPSVPVPLLLGMESNSASSSVSSSLDGPSASMPWLRRQDECKARRSAKITEEGYHLLNSCEKLSTDIDFFMERRSTALLCRRNERRLLLGALQGTIDSMCSPTNRRHRCHAEMYGSCATQLDLPSSDLDVVVRGIPLMPVDTSGIGFGQTMNHHYYLPPHPNAAHVMRLAAELEREPWAVHIKPIPTALVPVVKILADPSRLPSTFSADSACSDSPCEATQNASSSPEVLSGGPTTLVMNQWRGADVLNGLLSVDITFEGPGHGGIGSTAFAAKVVQDACNESKLTLEKTPLVQVFMVLKELLAQRRLNEPFSGGLSSYSLLLLVCAVVKDVKNLRRSLSFSDTRKQGKATDAISSEGCFEESSINSSNSPTLVRNSSSAETRSEFIPTSDDIGTLSFEAAETDLEQARVTLSKARIKETSNDKAPPKASLPLGKGIAVRSGTVTTTACSSVNGGTVDFATNSSVPSFSFSFFAQAGTGSNDILEVLCRGEPSPGKLLMHFLLFYGKLFDAKTTAIDVNANGSPFVARKPGGSMDPATGMFSVDQIVICDPLEGGEGHNVARSCFAWYSVRQVFSQCYATLVQSIESYGSGALDVNETSPLLALLLSY